MALILLGISKEEREEFIAEHDVESMTRVECQQAVKDRDQAEFNRQGSTEENLDLWLSVVG